jgi:hypothetical protein
LGNPTHRCQGETHGNYFERDPLRLCIIKSIISVTIHD